MFLNRRLWPGGLLAGLLLAAPVWAQNAFTVTCPNQLQAGAKASCGVSLNLVGATTMVDALDFTIAVTPSSGAPAAGKVGFSDSTGSGPLAGANTGYVSVAYSSVGPLTAGSNSLGNVTFTVPAGAAANQSYTFAFSGTEAECCSPTEVDISPQPSSSSTSTITVVTVLQITAPANSSSLAATANAPFSQQITTSGGQPPVSFKLGSGWPTGFSISSAGLITGTPTAAGSLTGLTVTATDSTTPTAETATNTYTLAVSSALSAISPASGALPVGTENALYPTQTLSVTGGLGPYSWSITAGSLPAGIALGTTSTTASTTISGTPTATANAQSVTVQVKDANGATQSANYTLTINGPLTVTSATLPAGDVSTPYLNGGNAVSLAATGGTSPYTWSLATGSNPLPAGLSLSTAGVISGTPTTSNNPGGISVTFMATDHAGATATQAITVVINPALSITKTTIPSATLNNAYPSTTVTSSGGTAPLAFSATGLPAGMSIAAATGIISGTPTTSTGSPFSVKVTLTDAAGASVSQSYTLPVNVGPSITPNAGALPGVTSGLAYSTALTVSGGTPPYTNWAATNLPAGLTIAGGGTNGATGTISGTTTVTGANTLSVSVMDNNGATATASLSLTVYAAPAVTAVATLPQATVGAAYTSGSGIAVTGGAPTVTVTTTPALSSGLSISASGVISGTPAAGTNGTTSYTIKATDANGASATAATSLTINPALSITTASPLPQATLNGPYAPPALTATGGNGAYTFSVPATGAGALPAGLSLSTAGVITGSPTTLTGSPFAVSVTVTDGNGVTATKSLALTVNPAISITTASPLPGATLNTAYATTLAATGGTGTLTFSQTNLPSGLALSAAGAISGSPTATGATANINVTVTDANGATGNKTFSLTVNAAPSITGPASLPLGTVSLAYPSTTVTAGGGTAPLVFSATGLPAGLSIASATGIISGTPTTNTGSPFSVVLKVTDANTATATKTLGLTIDPPLQITPGALPVAIPNVVYTNTTLVASGGSGTGYTFTATNLPTGISLSAAGVISGTATANAGNYNVVVTVTDSTGAQYSTVYSLVVAPPLSISGPSSLPSGVVNVAYPGATVTATGGSTPYTFTATGLPPGLTISSGGVVGGTPSAIAGSPYTVVVTVTDANKTTATKTYSIAVSATPLTITTGLLPTGIVNVPYPFTTISAQGGVGNYSWIVTGLPPGLTTDGNGDIKGTPTTTTGSPFAVKVTVSDQGGSSTSQNYSLTIVGPLTVGGPSTLPAAFISTAYTPTTLTASGGIPPYTWSATGLPTGMGIGISSGTISGTPATAAGSPYSVTVTLNDSTGAKATQTYSLVVNSPLSITGPATIPSATVGSVYTSTTITAAGGSGVYTWSATGLPSGMTIGSTTGAITGTPTLSTAGSYTVVVTVTDTNGATATKSYPLTVAPATLALPVISSVSTTAGGQSIIAPNTYVSIYGSNFAPASFTDTWTHLLPTPTTPLPVTLDNVSVTIGGTPMYVQYVSATQINVLTPNIGFGPLQVTVTTTAGTSNAVTINSQQDIPAFFPWPNTQPVATHLDYTYAVAAGTFAGVTTVPAKPGEVILLWGSGFGPTAPVNPFGVAIPATPTYSTSSNVVVMLNGAPLAVYNNIATLTPGFAGLFQTAVTIPASLANGTYPLYTSVNGVTSPTLMLTVHN